MHYPLVGERVWVSGCRDEFFVVEADYATCVATIVPVADNEAVRRNLRFSLLFAREDFEGAQAGAADPATVRDVLRSSHLCIYHAHGYMVEMQETIRATLATIQKSKALIEESNRLIARSQILDGTEMHVMREDQDVAAAANGHHR